MRLGRWPAAAIVFVAALRAAATLAGKADDLYERKIRPYLVERCYGCHATSGTRKQDLVLD